MNNITIKKISKIFILQIIQYEFAYIYHNEDGVFTLFMEYSIQQEIHLETYMTK